MEALITTNAGSVQIFKNPIFGQIRVQSNEKRQAWFCLSDVGQSLGLGRGVLYFQSGQWQPTAKGYFTTRTCKYVNSDDTIEAKIYTTVTERGRRYLWEMLKMEEGAL